MTKGRIACIAVEAAAFDGMFEMHASPAQKVCDWIPCSGSKWRSRPLWSEVYRHRALLTDAFVASRGFLLAQSDVTAARLRVAKNRHLTASTDDAEHCAYRSRCMMSQLRSARVDRTSPPSKYDLLRGVMMMAHITAPSFQLQRSSPKKTDAAWEEEVTDCHEICETALVACTPAHLKSSCFALVTVSDEELEGVMLVSDSRNDSEDTLDALMRNFCISVPSSEVAPQELVTVLGDDFIDNNNMDEETDGEAIAAPTAQGCKPHFSHAKAKPMGLSSDGTAGRTVNQTGSVCSPVKRAGKTKSDVSTPEKTNKASTKKNPPVVPVPSTLWT